MLTELILISKTFNKYINLNGMLVYRRVNPNIKIKFVATNVNIQVGERHCESVHCLVQERNTINVPNSTRVPA